MGRSTPFEKRQHLHPSACSSPRSMNSYVYEAMIRWFVWKDREKRRIGGWRWGLKRDEVERKKVDQSTAKPKRRRAPGCRVDLTRSFLEVCKVTAGDRWVDGNLGLARAQCISFETCVHEYRAAPRARRVPSVLLVTLRPSARGEGVACLISVVQSNTTLSLAARSLMSRLLCSLDTVAYATCQLHNGHGKRQHAHIDTHTSSQIPHQ